MASHSIPLPILDDLGSRFIINIPDEERKDIIRIMFQVELAKWFYDDEYVNTDASLTSCSMRDFCEHIFRRVPFLAPYVDSLDEVLEDWKSYKMAVPTYGAIILNPKLTKVLVVQGWWSRNSWGFPKGKVNEVELPHECAVREVIEETNCDVSQLIDSRHFLEKVINDQTVRLYLAPGVSEETVFGTKTKSEIRDWQWFPVDELPLSKKEAVRPNCLAIRNWNSFFMVMPFVRDMRIWIKHYKRNKFEFIPGYREPEQDHHFLPVQNQAQGRRNSTKKRKNSKSQSQEQSQPQPQVGGGGRQRKQSTQAQDAPPPPPVPLETFQCPKYWSNFHFKKKDILASVAAAPGWK